MTKSNFDWRRPAAEFFVIVIGVLVALAADQWWAERQDRKLEAEYLSRVGDNIRSDIENFERLERIFSIKAEITRDLRDHPDSNLLQRSSGDIVEGLVYSGYVALPDSDSTTYDELMSTGRFALIQNSTQRDAISQYYSGFEHLSQIMFEPIGEFKRVLWESFPAELLQRSRSNEMIHDPQLLRNGLDKLLADPRLPAAANAEMVYADLLVSYLSNYREEGEEVLLLLESSIAQYD